MFRKRFLTGLVSGLFSIALLFNCIAKDNQDIDRLPTQAQPKSMEEAISTIEDAIGKADLEHKVLTGLQKKINSKPAHSFTEEEIKLFVNKLLNEFGPDMPRDARNSLRSVLGFISKKLSTYKISGVAFACDPNIALIGDTQNPSFTALFKDAQGNVKNRIFDALITSWGLKVAFSINLDLIFFTGDIDFENSNKVLELGTGIDITYNLFATLFATEERLWPHLIPAISLLYAPFKNVPGGIFIIGTPVIGIASGISMVTSGTLIPRES